MACASCVGKDGRVWAPFDGPAPKTARESWPENFVEESDGWGRYYCPTCRDGIDAARARQTVPIELVRKPEPETQQAEAPKVEVVDADAAGAATTHTWWLIGLAGYVFSIFLVWPVNASVGRWMILSVPVIMLVGGAYYFAEGKTREERRSKFASNLLKVGLSIVGLWVLAQCSGNGSSNDGPIDMFFRR